MHGVKHEKRRENRGNTRGTHIGKHEEMQGGGNVPGTNCVMDAEAQMKPTANTHFITGALAFKIMLPSYYSIKLRI